MPCYTSLSNPIITVNKVSKDKTKLYVFVGPDTENKNIFNKIENGKSLTSTEEGVIKKLGGKFYKKWLNADFVKFIYDYIRLDDSINYIKKKIFLYLSDVKEKYFILEKNQELWVQPNPNEYNILGYHYVDKETGNIVDIKPSVHSKVEIDYDFVDKDGMATNKYDLVNEDLILFDAIDVLNENEYEIYVSNLIDFLDRLEKAKVKTITDKLMNGYIRKFYPEGKINISDALDNYKKTKNEIERDNKIINLVENVKVNEDKFRNCDLIHARVHINKNANNDIDLLKLFTYLRKNLSPNMPFIKYQDPEWTKPYSIIYDRVVKDKIVSDSTLIKWIGISKDKEVDYKPMKNVMIKIKIYELDGKAHYGTMHINRKGRIEFSPSYVKEYGATINDLIENIGDVSKLIKMINNYDIMKGVDIELPSAELVDGIVRTKENTDIIILSTIADYEIKVNYSDLFAFSKLFSPYITYKLDKDETEGRITLLYKRVSNFVNMADIYKYINEQIKVGVSEENIICNIRTKFDRTDKEAVYLMSDYKKRYGGYSSYDLMKQTGITSVINFNKNNIHINGAPSFFLLVNANKFMMALLTIYENRVSYLKNKDFKQLIMTSNDYIKVQEAKIKEETEDLISNIENIENIEDIEDIDLDDNTNFEEYNVEDYLKNMNEAIDIVDDEEKEYDTDYKKGLAKNDEIDPNIKLSCEDPLPELDTCRDLCNDRSYFLRRLHRHDPKLFNYSIDKSGKYEKYSRACQANNEYQPVVMRGNPEDNPKIDRNSFTYAIRYGSSSSNQNYYICPKVWCPYDQQPISFDKVKNIRTRITVEGKCTIGTCPLGDHEVFIMTKGAYTTGKYKEGLYPGFTSKMHPDGLCLPCCFKKPQNNPKTAAYAHFKRCLGEEVKDEEGAEENIRYILGNVRILQEGRFGVLPTDIAKLFGTDCDQGLIKKSCYLRQGIMYSEKQGFLLSIASIISEEKVYTVDELKEYLIDRLTYDIFRTLNGGSLEILFDVGNDKTPLENFKDFINSNEKIDETYLWDYLSRPNILYEGGTNIVIMTEETLLCPYSFHVKEFYTLGKKTVFIIKYSGYYTPIYYVDYNMGEIIVQKFFSSIDSVVMNILMVLINNCKKYPSMDWKRILKDNEEKYGIDYDIELEKQYTLLETIKLLENIKVKSQIIDLYNKVVAVLLVNGIYIPVSPSAIINNIEVISIYDINLLNYNVLKDSLTIIDKKTKINCLPTYKILSEDNKNIIAMILSTGRIVPVKPTKFVKDNLPIKDIPYYSNANKYIVKGDIIPNKRIETVNRMEYENETYNRIRFELSKYLSINKDKLDELKSILDNKKSLSDKRKEVMSIITNLLKKIISTKEKKIDFSTYITPNTRSICFESKECNKDPHCIKDGDKCKLHVYSKNLITGKDNIKIYTEMLVEELVRNRMKREDILKDKISEIIDKQKILPSENEIIFFGRDKNDLERIAKLYYEEQHIYVKDIEPFDRLEPKFYGIPKEYREFGASDETIHLEFPSGHWQKILGKDFMIYRTKDGVLFDAISRGLSYVEPEMITPLELRKSISEYDVPEDIIMDIAEKMNITLRDDEEDERDLLLELYKKYSRKMYKDIGTIPELKSYISKAGYDGTLVDIYLLSRLYNINIIVLDHRLKGTDKIGMTIISSPLSPDYMLLYSQSTGNRNTYDIVEKNGKYVFKKHDFSDRFIALINEVEEKKFVANIRPKANKKIVIKKIKKVNKASSGKKRIKIKKK